MSDLVALRPGTILVDDYRIERVLGAGGFGITYLAEEVPLARLVTIKEYFPVDFAARDQLEDVVPRSRECEGDYTWGLDRFLAEAQTLARFNHPNIVRVYRFFQARNTGYIVLHFEEGQSLKGWLRGLGRAPRQHELDRIVEPLLGALETVHTADYLHRDIAPDNIMIRRDGQPVLIDFGSARGDIAKHSKTISALVKPGYSPYEQYATTSSRQGPWTDIYSLGATLYEAVTNRRPPDAPSRMVADELIPPADAALSSYRPQFLAAIAKSLRLEINERPRTVAEWRAELMAPAARAAPPAPGMPEPAVAVAAAPAASPAQVDAEAKVTAPGAAVSRQARSQAAPAEAARPDQPAAKADAPRRSLAGAFLAGWREAHPPETSSPPPTPPSRARVVTPDPPAAIAPPPAAPSPRPSVVAAPRRRGLFRRQEAAPPPPPPPPPEPGARRATPRAIARRSGSRWRSLAAKLVLGICVATLAVMLQDRLPTVRREGAGVLTSQTNVDVALAELKGHRGGITGLAFVPDGQSIVTASSDGTLRLWSATRGSLVRTFELDGGAATALAVVEGRAAVGHKDGTVAVFDLATGAKLASLKRNDAPVAALAFTGRAGRLVVAAEDGALVVWNLAVPGKPEALLEGHDGAVRSVSFIERGPFVASGSVDQTVKLWSLDKAEVVRTYRGHADLVTAVAANADGTVLASGDRDGQIRLWSTYANRLKRRLKGPKGASTALAFTADGEHLAASGTDGIVRFWDIGKGKLLRAVTTGTAAVTALAIAPDGRRFASGLADGTVRIWDATVPKAGI